MRWSVSSESASVGDAWGGGKLAALFFLARRLGAPRCGSSHSKRRGALFPPSFFAASFSSLFFRHQFLGLHSQDCRYFVAMSSYALTKHLFGYVSYLLTFLLTFLLSYFFLYLTGMRPVPRAAVRPRVLAGALTKSKFFFWGGPKTPKAFSV